MTKNTADTVPVIRDVYPYLCVRDAAATLEFYTRVFGAEELLRLTDQSGRVAHAELKLGPALSPPALARPGRRSCGSPPNGVFR